MSDHSKALIWMIGAIASFTAMAVAGREVSFQLDTFEIMTYRSLIGIAIVCLYGMATGAFSQIGTERISLHLLRNIAHFVGQNLWFFALPLIPLAQVFALEFTVPIWVILLTPFVLSDKITKTGIIAAVIGFIGILVVTRPGVMDINVGIIAAATAAIGFALTALFTRRLMQTETVFAVLFYLTVMQAVFGIICAGWDATITLPDPTTAPFLLVIGAAGLFAHLCLTNALALAPASTVMPIDFMRLPIIAVVGMLFYNEPFDEFILIGGAIIFAANYLNIRANR